MAKKSRKTVAARASGSPRALTLVCGVVALELLTFCGGKSESDDASAGARAGRGAAGAGAAGNGGSAAAGNGGAAAAGNGGFAAAGNGGFAAAGNGGFSFGGHTASCISDPCGPGCGTRPECGFSGASGRAGEGGSAAFSGASGSAGTAGTSGFSGNSGTAGNAGFSFGGHTAGCIDDPCGPGCFAPGMCGTSGGSGSAGQSGAGGQSAAAGQSGEGGSGDEAGQGGEPAGRDRRRTATSEAPERACYLLPGYDPDPCLAADDSLAGWLEGLPAGCEPHVMTGPVFEATPAGRRCCYGVTCSEESTQARGTALR